MAWCRPATSQYLNQWWLVCRCIYASLGPNELKLLHDEPGIFQPIPAISSHAQLHWNLGVVIMPILESLVAPEVVIMTTSGAARDAKIGIMTTLIFQCQQVIITIIVIIFRLYLRLPFKVCMYIERQKLTHWGRVMHICIGKLTIIGSDNGLFPGRRQAIIWSNVGKLLIGPLGTNFSESLIEIYTFSLKKMHLKMSSGKRPPFCLGLNVFKDHIPCIAISHYNVVQYNRILTSAMQWLN